MLFDDLRKANMQAMKDKDSVAKGIYSVVINKCMLQSIEKKANNQEFTDEDVITIIKKTIKELSEEYASFEQAGRVEKCEELAKQKDILSKYVPSQMSEEQIVAEINKLEDKSMQNIMKHFKMNFNGQCDMKLVSQLAKNAK